MQFLNQEDVKKRVMQEVYSVDPLSDKAFKKLLESDEWFKKIAELTLNRPIPDGSIISIQGESSIWIKGKTIRTDNLRKTPIGVVNMEAQKDPGRFPFKRHLYYWAAIYSHILEESQAYRELVPAFAIVFYKDRGRAALFENAYLDGTLLHTEDDRDQLHLIAVNVARWREAQDEELKQTLSTLYNGLYRDDNAHMFEGVNVRSEYFKAFNNVITQATANVKYDDAKERGDKAMEALLGGFLTEEQEKAVIEKIAKNLLRIGLSADLIKEATDLPIERLNELKEKM